MYAIHACCIHSYVVLAIESFVLYRFFRAAFGIHPDDFMVNEGVCVDALQYMQRSTHEYILYCMWQNCRCLKLLVCFFKVAGIMLSSYLWIVHTYLCSITDEVSQTLHPPLLSPPLPSQLGLCDQPLTELSNPGASRSLFYISGNNEFLIKT